MGFYNRQTHDTLVTHLQLFMDNVLFNHTFKNTVFSSSLLAPNFPTLQYTTVDYTVIKFYKSHRVCLCFSSFIFFLSPP